MNTLSPSPQVPKSLPFNAMPYLLRRADVVGLGLKEFLIEGLVQARELRTLVLPNHSRRYYLRCDLAPLFGQVMDWSRWDDPRQFPELLCRGHLRAVGFAAKDITAAVEESVLGTFAVNKRHRFYKWEVGELIGRAVEQKGTK